MASLPQQCFEGLRRLIHQHEYMTDACKDALRREPSLEGSDDEEGDGELHTTVGMMMVGTRVERVSVREEIERESLGDRDKDPTRAQAD